MKILYFSDMHLVRNKPLIRPAEESFVDVQMDKIDKILNIAKENNADMIVSGGDLFDTFKPDYDLLLEFVNRYKKFDFKPFKMVLGNHDIEGRNIASYKRSVIGILEHLNVLAVPDADIVMDKFVLRFVHYKDAIDLNELLFKDEYNGYFKAIVIHGMIVPKQGPFECLPIDQIKTNANLILTSHFHTPFSQMQGNTLYINSGVIIRSTKDEADITPSVLLIDVDPVIPKLCGIKVIKLDVVKLQVSEIVTSETSPDASFDEYIKSFSGISSLKTFDLQYIVDSILDKKGWKEDVELRKFIWDEYQNTKGVLG